MTTLRELPRSNYRAEWSDCDEQSGGRRRRRAVERIERERITGFGGVPAMVIQVLDILISPWGTPPASGAWATGPRSAGTGAAHPALQALGPATVGGVTEYDGYDPDPFNNVASATIQLG
jgi:hypothetical protein